MISPGVIIDSNLLLLFVIGSADKSYISLHKKLKGYSAEDYDLLLDTIKHVPKILVTPHILAETSNLLDHGGVVDPVKTAIILHFQKIIGNIHEKNIGSSQIAANVAFARLGVADVGIVELIKDGVWVITTDLDLYLEVQKKNGASVNFNHLRKL